MDVRTCLVKGSSQGSYCVSGKYVGGGGWGVGAMGEDRCRRLPEQQLELKQKQEQQGSSKTATRCAVTPHSVVPHTLQLALDLRRGPLGAALQAGKMGQ